MNLNFGKRLNDFAYRDPRHDRMLSILDGAVRSGKTWALHPKIIFGCNYPVAGWKVITGASKESVYDNVLNDLFDLIGDGGYHYNRQSGLLHILGTHWRVIGAKDEGSEKFIRGKTIGYAVCDELTLMPQSFFNMLVNRMSPAGARLYGTTNPDTPLHWLKTDWIDNQALRRAGKLYRMHCTMADNPNLTPEYVQSMRMFYKGQYYARYILGEWVMAEGSIYRDVWDTDRNTFLDADLPVGLYGAGGTQERVITVDYGTTNPCVYHDWRDDGKTAWAVNEYRWDSAKEMRQKTDDEYAEDMIKFIGPEKGCEVIVDPSAASLKAAFVKKGLWVTNAKNDVQDGIQKTMSALASGVLRFHRIRCEATIGEMQNYSWDPKKAAKGVEEPIKQADHGPDSVRYYAATKIPIWRLA